MRTPTRPTHVSDRAFGLAELIVVLIAIILLAIVLVVIIGGGSRRAAVSARDAPNIRGITQAQILWAQNHRDRYVLPSVLDPNDNTVPETGRAKDTTANIYSVLIYNALVTPELLVSPAEQGNVVKDDDYELALPTAAVNANAAQWDPAFRADFTGEQPGNASYAHAIPHPIDPEQIGHWGSSFDSNQVAISNRGPQVTAVTHTGGAPNIQYDTQSLTLVAQGGQKIWAGYVGYNDNHVSYVTGLGASGTTFLSSEARMLPDVLFFDEPESRGHNNFLSIFTAAGDNRADFNAIWD
jgi:hypothetical protein